ncbi:hypothetical protein M0R04_09520 [Candidatus Dojkabacteria bacterium]|jgi:hypothetical protein|nr:hypothetical protein [Candidatus Dojkabacteria bacterium]
MKMKEIKETRVDVRSFLEQERQRLMDKTILFNKIQQKKIDILTFAISEWEDLRLSYNGDINNE